MVYARDHETEVLGQALEGLRHQARREAAKAAPTPAPVG